MTTQKERDELRNLAACCDRCMTKTIMVPHRQLLALLDDLEEAQTDRDELINALVDRDEAPFGLGSHYDAWREWLRELAEDRAKSKGR